MPTGSTAAGMTPSTGAKPTSSDSGRIPNDSSLDIRALPGRLYDAYDVVRY
ncbi:hypothetical protein Baya_6972 [Bagarius yarrelli]|uniref:Uncharacterized protein n=1 Tax=Bagarius yarrelli TaxID=175774 RepID=A0A556U3F3_BAGYA|nr:hypothetical protein Baya_6972 [Bagarius yarrelli]